MPAYGSMTATERQAHRKTRSRDKLGQSDLSIVGLSECQSSCRTTLSTYPDKPGHLIVPIVDGHWVARVAGFARVCQ